jgi:hypothetical protein
MKNNLSALTRCAKDLSCTILWIANKAAASKVAYKKYRFQTMNK